jgi:hypothetical protein
MATCIHGTHWDGVDAFWCPQCATVASKSTAPFTFSLCVPQTGWSDVVDEWTTDIEAAFPTRSGSHEEYATAMRMVGHRHSKGELVALVNWLLVERARLGGKNLAP